MLEHLPNNIGMKIIIHLVAIDIPAGVTTDVA